MKWIDFWIWNDNLPDKCKIQIALSRAIENIEVCLKYGNHGCWWLMTNFRVCLAIHHYVVFRSLIPWNWAICDHFECRVNNCCKTRNLMSNSPDRHPAWSIVQNLMECGHKLQDCDSNNRGILFRNYKMKMSRAIEPAAMRKMNPTLCIGKQPILTLPLPW